MEDIKIEDEDISDYYIWSQQHPIEWAEKILGVTLESKQKDLLISVRDNERTDFKSGNEVGKTFGLATCGLHFLYTRVPSTVIVTASTDRQIKNQFWTELVRLWYGAKHRLPGRVITKFIEVDPKKKWFMLAFSTSEEAKFEGYHNENILLIFDESKAIRPDIWRAGERLFRGVGVHKRWIAAGTPPMGPVGEFCQISLNPKKARLWNHIHCSGWDSPRIDKAKCQEALDTYGEDNPFYVSMVLGQIPLKSENAIIDLNDIAKATRRKMVHGDHIDNVSVDVARKGEDETVISYQKNWCVFQDVFRGKDKTTWIVARIKKLLAQQEDAKDIPIRIDDIGVGCVTRDTELLTPSGWVKADDIRTGDKIYSKNNDGVVTVEYVKDNILREKTKILRSGNIRFAAFHFLPYRTRSEHKFSMKTWEEVLTRKYIYFDNEFNWPDKEENNFIIPEQTITMPYGGKKIINQRQIVSGPNFCSFLGWFLSEGHLDKRCIGITQSKKSKHNDEIISIMGKLNPTVNSVLSKSNEYTHKFNNGWLADWLANNCYDKGKIKTAPYKRIPDFIRLNSKKSIVAFLDSFLNGDGYWHRDSRHYVTTSRSLRDGLSEMMLRVGLHSNYCIRAKKGSFGYIYGRKITRRYDVYCIYEYSGKRTGICLTPKDIEESYDNVRYIKITGETRLFINRFNYGRPFWSHNGGVTDMLEAEDYYAVPINVARSAVRNDIYYDLGTEIYAQLGQVLKDKPIAFKDDPELISQLYDRVDTRLKQKGGKILLKILSKEELRKDPLHEGNPSPDRADSLAMLLCDIPPPEKRKADKKFVGGAVLMAKGTGGWTGRKSEKGKSAPLPASLGMMVAKRRK